MKDLLRKIFKAGHLMGMPVARRALLGQGVAATIEHLGMLRRRRFALILDVGANRGQFSLAARMVQPQARIVAFEPLATAADAYRRVFQSDGNTTLHQYAIGPSSGEAIINLSQREDSSSLLAITEQTAKIFPGVDTAGTATIVIAPLTRFVSLADLAGGTLLKIDVQGFELEVLRSAAPLLPGIEWIYVEASFMEVYAGQALAHEIIDFLHANGFVLTGCYNGACRDDGTMIQADLLFEKRGTP